MHSETRHHEWLRSEQIRFCCSVYGNIQVKMNLSSFQVQIFLAPSLCSSPYIQFPSEGVNNFSPEPAVALGNVSVDEVWSKAQHRASYGGAQPPLPYPGWKQPCCEREGATLASHQAGVWWGAHIRAESQGPAALCPPQEDLPSNSCIFFYFVPFILYLSQYFFFQLIRRGVAVRGRACDADGAGGAKEKTDFHHEEQALEDGEEALSAQVPITLGIHTWGLCWLSDALCLS